MRTRCASLPVRLSALSVLALLPVALAPSQALAAGEVSLTPALASASWYAASQTSAVIASPAPAPSTGPVVLPGLPLPALPDPPAVPPANPVATAGVPEDGVAVAAVPNGADASGAPLTRPERESYLEFDLDSVPDDATVDTFRLTVFLDPDSQSQNAAGADLIACLPDSPGLPDTRGEGFDKKPVDDCSEAVAGKRSADATSWSFDVPEYAQSWVSEINSGAAIRSAPTSQPFQIVLDPARTTAQMRYTPAVTEDVAPPPPPVEPGPFVPADPEPFVDPVPFDPGTEGTPGEFIPGEPFSAPIPEMPVAEVPVTEPGVTAPQAAPPALTPQAAPAYRGDLSLSWPLWAALAGLLAMMVLCSRILGDPEVVSSDARARALSRYRFPVRSSLLDRRLARLRVAPTT